MKLSPVETLEAIDELLTGEIMARFSHPSMTPSQVAKSSQVFSLLVVPCNMARAALGREPIK